ncbi:TPA: hypothetical protein NNW70_004194 [Salmonella enterica]|nr:hypothetical protein [Salmonella enterica]HCH9607904.1 hypothetical protein [Salmonella enterica]HDI5000198.1 hypothetical protein [Salmonella enterica]
MNGEQYDVVLLGHGRIAPINLVVFQCVDVVECFGAWDDVFTYYAAEIESWNWDGDGGDEIQIEDIKDDLYKVEKVQVTNYEWRKV